MRRASGGALVAQLDRARIDASLIEVERLARAAQTELARGATP
jgi:hypothetical protein